MKKNIYFVDTENVHNNWLSLLDTTEAMKIYLFYTQNTPHIPYDTLKSLTKHIRSLNMISCKPGPNALDFQLISYLSFILKKRTRHNYVIVSNDKGYDVVIDFWNERGFSISRMNTQMLGVPAKKATTTKNTNNTKKAKKVKQKKENVPPKTKAHIQKTFIHYIAVTHPDFNPPDELFDFLTNILNAYPKLELQAIHKDFTKKFGQDLGTKYYRTSKSYMKQQY